MSGSPFNLGTKQPVQSVDSEMPDVPVQSVDIEMPDAPVDSEMTDIPVDRNTVSSEDGIKQPGRGRPTKFSADQGNLYNSSDVVSRGGESVPHGQDGPTSVVSNRGGYAIRSHDTQPISVFPLGPQEVVDFNAIRAAKEHQCSPGRDGEDVTPVDAAEYECGFCKAREAYYHTAGQNDVHWDTVLS
ncbi:hypothetical protein ACKLNR_014384 [Fusarium oxysporum f. sp. zingiberi]